MKYVYMVTSLIEGLPRGTRNLPNLGLHTSLAKARRHYNSVINYRKDRGYQIHWDNHGIMEFYKDERYLVAREAYLSKSNPDGQTKEYENLRIEMWKVR